MGPIGPYNAVVLMTLYLLREVEGSTAKRRNVTVNDELRTVTWRLPASKQDPYALGVERTWGCVCDGVQEDPACPYEAACRQHKILLQKFGAMTDDDELPFFPSVHGEVVDEEVRLKFIKKLAEVTGQPTCSPEGVELLGRHSFRATGAVYLRYRSQHAQDRAFSTLEQPGHNALYSCRPVAITYR